MELTYLPAPSGAPSGSLGPLDPLDCSDMAPAGAGAEGLDPK